MALLKWLKGDEKKMFEAKNPTDDIDEEEERRREEEGRDARRANEEEAARSDGTKIVYLAYETPKQDVIDTLQSIKKDVHVSSFFKILSNKYQFQILDFYR